MRKNLTQNLGVLAFLIVFILGMFVAGWIALERIEKQTRDNIGEVLQTVLITTQDSMYVWFENRSYELSIIAESTDLIRLTEELLAIPKDRLTIVESKQLQEIREFFAPRLDKHGDLGMFIIDKDLTSIASMRDRNIGTTNLIELHRPALLQQVLDGQIIFVPTIPSDVPLPGRFGNFVENYPTVFIAGPIRNKQGEIIAILAIRLDLRRDFSRITKAGRIGETGETYAFDQDGTLITASRFDEQMRKISYLDRPEEAILSIKVTDPGGNLIEGYIPELRNNELPLTKMAQSAIAGESGLDIEGYRDYRGVPVLGAWLWDDKLGLGITTEIDLNDALSSYYTTRWILVAILIFATVLALVLTTLMLVLRRRGETKLKTAYNELEDRVRIRTKDLEDARSKLSEANTELQKLATIDALTGLANRRKFDEFLQNEWSHCLRYKKPISIAMLDIDYFKQYNDTYGHQAGDKCLVQISDVITANKLFSRPGDLFARYGGEEFALILSDTHLESARVIANKILDAVRTERINHETSQVEGIKYVTISIGLASEAPDKNTSYSSLIKKADESLYVAKNSGRNSLIVYGDDTQSVVSFRKPK